MRSSSSRARWVCVPLPDALAERLDRLRRRRRSPSSGCPPSARRCSGTARCSGGVRSGSRTSRRERKRRRSTPTGSARSRRRSPPSASSSCATRWCSTSTIRCATHIPEAPRRPHGRDALSHLSGLQREPPGEIWETMTPPSREELLAGLEDAERVLAPGEAWHYSNLAFGLLGEVVARRSEQRVRGRSRAHACSSRSGSRAPASTRRARARPATSSIRTPTGSRVEPDLDGRRADRGDGLALVDGRRSRARGATSSRRGTTACWRARPLDEMARVRTMVDEARWSVGWGLGLGLYRRGERVLRGPRRRDARVRGVASASTGPSGPARPCSSTRARGQTRTRSRSTSPRRRSSELARVPSSGVPTTARPRTSSRCSGAGGRRAPSSCSPGARGASGSRRSRTPRDRDVSLAPARWRRHAGASSKGASSASSSASSRDDDGAPVKLYVATYPLTRAPAVVRSTASDSSSRSPAA